MNSIKIFSILFFAIILLVSISCQKSAEDIIGTPACSWQEANNIIISNINPQLLSQHGIKAFLEAEGPRILEVIFYKYDASRFNKYSTDEQDYIYDVLYYYHAKDYYTYDIKSFKKQFGVSHKQIRGIIKYYLSKKKWLLNRINQTDP